MPGERRELFSGCCTIPVARNSTIHLMEKSSTNKDQNREHRIIGTTSIPLPKSGQFSNNECNQKIDSKFAKTEKNRLRLIIQSNEEEREDDSFITSPNTKDQRKIVISTRDSQTPVHHINRTIPRYHAKYSDTKRNADKKKENSLQRPKQSFMINSERTTTTTCIENTRRVGVEGRITPSLNSLETVAAPPAITRDSLKNIRPYYAARDPPLSCGELVATELQYASSDTNTKICPTFNNPLTRFIEKRENFRERCQSGIVTFRNHRVSDHRKGDDMDRTDANGDNVQNSGTSSPEFYARSVECYDEDGSSEEDSKRNDDLRTHRPSTLYHDTWPVKRDLWTGRQMSLPGPHDGSAGSQQNDMASVMSFSSSTAMSSSSVGMHGHRRLGAKVDVVYSLLGMLGSTEGREDMSTTLLALSNSIDSCLIMRQSGCLPLLVQLIHAPGQDHETRERASRALHNVIHARSDEKVGRREARVLRLLEQVRDYCQALRASLETARPSDDLERHPGPTIAALMKLSFDEAHRHAMCQLGGLHAVSELIEMDHASHGSESDDQSCITLRRYAGMALTNLTFGDGNNKALLCSFRAFMKALVSQLRSLSDDLRQVTASVLRNLSWRADSNSKRTLREVGAVTGLMKAAMEGRKESTLKSILSALWNLSAHCSTNKVDICAVEGALAFLVDMLSYKAPSKTLSIVENAGGILRNVSSHIAVREDYRKIVRERDCLQVLLRQLRSPSLTVVSNACGALWNLSARCPHDQRLLWDLGAVPMLRSLVHSKHKMISMGSSAALKNLLSARPAGGNLVHLDSTARGLGLPTLPTLVARRQRALEQEIDQNLAETCDNIEPSTSPTNKEEKFSFKVDQTFNGVTAPRGRSYQTNPNQSLSSGSKYGTGIPRSDSRESMRSVTSTHSDTIFERVNRRITNGISPAESQMKQQSSSLHSAVCFNAHPSYPNTRNKTNHAEKKYALRYKNTIPERLGSTELGASEIGDLRCANSTISWSTAPDQESACSQFLMHSSIEDSLSPTSSSKLSIGTSNADFIKRSDDSSVHDSRVNYKNSSVRSPKENLTFDGNFVITTTVPCDIAIEKQIQSSSAMRQTSKTDSFEETSLDQPTNYGLRYAERNSDEDEKESSGYFAETEQDFEDTVKTYYTKGTPYETPFNSSGDSDNDLPEVRGIRPISQKINLARIDDVAREIRREGYSHKKPAALQSETVKKNSDALLMNHSSSNTTMLPIQKNSDTLLLNCSPSNIHMLPNSFNHASDVIESSESLTKFDHSVTERSVTSPYHPQSVTSGFDVDTASRIDTAVTRLNYLVLNDEPKIINDSTPNNSKYLAIGNHDSLNVKRSPDSMISDGDDDDEDLLAACIHIGMQNNRHRQSFRRNSLEKTPPAESNLARYQTSVALDQVETNESNEQTNRSLQSDSSRFNAIKMTAVSTSDYHQMDTAINEYTSFENNFDVGKNDDNVTIEYQKLEEYSCDQEKKSNLDDVDGNVTGKSETFPKSKTQAETFADSVMENFVHDEIVNDVAGNSDSGSNRETRDSESMESFDSVERSEQALLQLCIKTSTSKTETIPMSESDSIFMNAGAIKNPNFEVLDDVSSSCVTVTITETLEEPVSPVARQNQAKNVEDEYRRQRDPDAMIASLDRLTATLVQQTEAMRERESSTMKQSVHSDTWNEDSPNDVSYPSISVSAPLIASFKSDIIDEEYPAAEMTISKPEERENYEFTSMTNSRIIEREAIRLAEVVSAEATKQQQNYGSSSLTSNDLEAIGPPSMMDRSITLTTSYVGPPEKSEHSLDNNDRCYSSLSPIRVKGQNFLDVRNCRKKSLPIGVMAKRALAHDLNHAGSLESLLNDCSLGTNSQLENVMPPSLMDEIFDNGDMENSMLSVASITSEIADPKDQDSNSLNASDPIFDLVQPVANVLSITCMRYAAAMNTSGNDSASEYLENINPPSLLNEISDMDDSTMEANTDTMCSDTLCIDTDLRADEISQPMIVDPIEEFENDTDEAGTPITTESCYSSSAESTPKKRSHKGHLTPKQKRQLAKERFKTYTIAAELVKKEEDERRKLEQAETEICKISRGKCSPFSKLTPKQRRQEDPARFQTQVLTDSLPDFLDRMKKAIGQDQSENPEKIEQDLPANSSIPTLVNLCGSRTFRRKRTDNKENVDRYRTRTLNDGDVTLLPENLEANGLTIESQDEKVIGEIESTGCETMRTMLEKNANIVLRTLNETSKVVDATIEDTMLDCETLSLVSNESESEHSLRMRLANAHGKELVANRGLKVSQLVFTCRPEESATISENHTDTNDQKIETREERSESSDSESDEDSSRNIEEQPRQTQRPKIVKPDMGNRDFNADSQVANKSEPGSPKGIRGRRKALYSSPNTRKPTPQSSPIKQISNPVAVNPIGRSNTSPVVRATRATTLRQNTNVFFNAGKDSTKSNFVQKTPQSSNVDKRSKNIALAKRSSIPQRGSTYTSKNSAKRHSTPPGCTTNSQKEPKVENPPIKSLERQGTFTKDESEVENVPTVVFRCSPSKSKIAKPTRDSPVHANPSTVGKSKISVKTHQNAQQSRLIKCSSADRIQTSRTSPSLAGGKKISTIEPTASSGCQIDRSSSQGTTNEIGKTPRRLTSLGQRSNSNSSFVSTPTTSVTGRKLPKEATSKIASLWKKIEDSKNKQKLEKPDTRQWITASTADSTDSQEVTLETKPPTFKLFRSSTFEGVPQESDDIVPVTTPQKPIKIFETHPSASKYRNSCDLTGMTPASAPCKIPVKLSGKETPIGYGTIVLRKQRSADSNAPTEVDGTKRISRLGSFIRVTGPEAETSGQVQTSETPVRTPISAIVPPFNYNPRQEVTASTTKTALRDDNHDIYEFQTEIVTGSARVTTV